jgi:hypothetical protein
MKRDINWLRGTFWGLTAMIRFVILSGIFSVIFHIIFWIGWWIGMKTGQNWGDQKCMDDQYGHRYDNSNGI